MFENIKSDINAALERDPAARNRLEVLLTYSGIKALLHYRVAHWLYQKGWRLLPRIICARARTKTGIDIHPGAVIGKGMFIDHGCGVVIGETTEIGDNVTLYQGVTLGGTGKDVGKRHPTLGNNVMVSAGAKILGPVSIGDGCKIGAGSVVLKDVPPHCTVVGVPGRIVRMHGVKYNDMDQKLPDPILEEFARLNKRLQTLEEKMGVTACRYSIANQSDIAETSGTQKGNL
jgi:serine O-acetyltransferase